MKSLVPSGLRKSYPDRGNKKKHCMQDIAIRKLLALPEMRRVLLFQMSGGPPLVT
jgi:hypothetical protein